MIDSHELRRRDGYLNKLIGFQDTEPVKVITGIRRCGKSSLLKLMVQHLKDIGIQPEQIIEMNFESFDFRGMSADDIYRYVKERIVLGKRMYLFFDELQRIEAWEDAINAFRVDFDCDIYVTGSNAYLLSSEYSTYISGRVGRVEIPDNTWFSGDLTDVESAVVSLTPVIIEENGDRIQLPAMEMVVDPPQSPITVISPAEEDLSVSTSIYPLEIQVVPGSTVLINGEDATEFVDRAGLLSKNVNVYPVGDNVYTILVRTPNHKETRVEVVIYRAQLDIEIELDTSVSNESSSSTMLITGKTEPGAMITVDTEHLPESVYIDMETGKFSFMAKFATIGENIVRFHASMEGREDASISMTVEYVPTLAEYSKSAWKMDYTQLRRLFEQWKGRVFLCEGEIVHVFVDGDDQYCIMDVGTDEQQWIVLLNESGIGSPTVGREYSAYADVQGRYLYEANYYPLLTARYMDLKKAE